MPSNPSLLEETLSKKCVFKFKLGGVCSTSLMQELAVSFLVQCVSISVWQCDLIFPENVFLDSSYFWKVHY